MDCFKIEWKGFYPIDTIQEQPEARQKGVYAFYEMALGYPYQLLYIGKSQKPSKRVMQHLQGLSRFQSEADRRNISVALGVITPLASKSNRISPEQLRDVENILIQTAKTKGNSSSKSYNGRPIIVVNMGKTGLLKKVISSHPELLELIRE